MGAEMLRRVCIVASAALGLLGTMNAANAVDYRLQRYKADFQIAGGNWLVDALKNKDVKTALQAVAAAYGINPAYIEAAATVANVLPVQGSRFQAYIVPPEGFTPCKVRIVERVSSAGSGTIAVRVYPWKAHVDVTLQKQNDGRRSWIDYDIEVLSIYWRHYRDPDWKPGMNSPPGKKAVDQKLCDYVHDDVAPLT